MLKKIASVILAVIIGMIPLTTNVSHASPKNEGVVGYTIKAEIPENQIDKSKTYFDLMMKPGEEQDLVVDVYNYSGETGTFKAELVYATTNHNGSIEYTETDIKKADKSMKYPFPKIAKLKEDKDTLSEGTLTLANNKSGKLNIHVKMPKNEIEGVILGGIRVTKVKSDEEILKEEEEGGIKINNEYSYVIGAQLRMNNRDVLPNLNFVNVRPALLESRTAVLVNLQNDKPVRIGKLKLDGEILKDGKVVREFFNEDFDIAPNVNFDVPFRWENERIEQGNYTLKLKATDGNETWEWTEKFKIGAEVEKINDKAVFDEEERGFIFIAVIVLVVVLVGGLITLLILKKRNRDTE